MTGGIEDPRFTEELLFRVLNAFEAAGYHQASSQHTVTTMGMLGELARLYAGERPTGSGVRGAEEAARRTVALAAAGDFQAERDAYSAGGPAPDWQTWALRLASAVGLLAAAPAGGRDLDDLDDDAAAGWEALGRLAVLEGAVHGLRQDLEALGSRIGLLEAARTQDAQALAELLGQQRGGDR